MEKLPHRYTVVAKNETGETSVSLTAAGVAPLLSAPPSQFGGPGDQWSPEDLLIASVADCFVLTFRAIARASKLEWESIQCEAEGILDRVDKVTKFTEIIVKPSLTITNSDTMELAERLLHKAEAACLITNSLNSKINLVIGKIDCR